MTASTSLLAYQDCTEYMDRALEEPKGIRIQVKDEDAAIHLRSRMHYGRKLHRQENARVYADQRDHPMYGKSPYDALVIKIKRLSEGWYLYLERTDLATLKVESLEQVPDQPEIKPERQEVPKAVIQNIVSRRI